MTENGDTVVIIEDDHIAQSGLAGKLGEEGVKAVAVRRSDRLLDEIAAAAPRIIITDIDRSDILDPCKILSSIKGDERLRDAEIFVYTDTIDVQTEVAIKKLKIYSYFEKSKDPQYLVTAVLGHFEQARMAEDERGVEEEVGAIDLAERGFDVTDDDGYYDDGEEGPADLKGLLEEFREGVNRRIESAGGDAGDTHYNLGMSYLEMELLEQALAEFHESKGSPALAEKSMNMIGVVYRRMGNYDKAVEAFKEGYKIASDDFSKLSFRYEIADTLENSGRSQEAYKIFATVYQADKSFKDVRSRLITLKSSIEIKNNI